MRDDAGRWVHLVAVEEEVLGLGEGDGLAAEEVEGSGAADGGELGFDLRGVDSVGRFAEETEEDGAVGSVADAGEGERSVEMDDDAGGAIEETVGVERAGEAESGSHGTNGV